MSPANLTLISTLNTHCRIPKWAYKVGIRRAKESLCNAH